MRLKYILFLFIFCTKAYSTENIQKYDSLTNRAEISISQNEISVAQEYYNQAFTFINNPFAQDIYNYTLCCIINKMPSEAIEGCEKLVLKGFSISFFEKSIFKNLINNTVLWNKFKLKYPDLIKQRNQNIEVQKLLDEFIDADQSFFCDLPSKKTNNKFLDSLKINSLNISEKVINLLENKELTEEKIGVQIIQDTIFIPFPKYYILLRHHYQNGLYNFSNKLEFLRRNGLIRSDIFYNLLDIQLNGQLLLETLILNYDCILIEFNSIVLRDKIQQLRRKYNLPNLEDTKLKIMFNEYSNRVGYSFSERAGVVDELTAQNGLFANILKFYSIIQN